MATKPKGKNNGTANKGTASKLAIDAGNADGENGRIADNDRSGVGPAASEPLAGGNGDAAGAIGGNNGGTGNAESGETIRNPDADAPAEPKRRAGRHPAACECAKCVERRANGPASIKRGVALNNKGWAEAIFGAHQFAATLLPIPDIELFIDPATNQPNVRPKEIAGKPVMLAHITKEQSQQMADAAYEVALEYNLARYFTGKKPKLGVLVFVLASVYYPKVQSMRLVAALQKQQRQQNTQEPQTAADMVNPQKPGENGGVYKYGP